MDDRFITAPAAEHGFLSITPERYRQIEALSQSGIKTICQKSALHYAVQKVKATAAMDFGTIVHAIALGIGDFEVSPYDEFRTNEAKAWRDDRVARGVAVIKAKDYEAAEILGNRIKAVIDQMTDGAAWIPEQAFTWQMETALGTIECKALADVWCPSKATVIDIKTTGVGIGNSEIERYFDQRGCAIQSKFYRQGIGHIDPRLEGRVKFKTVVFETSEPYQHRVCENSGAYDMLAESQISHAAMLYAKGIKTGDWEGYPTDTFSVVPKPWALAQFIEDEADAA
jgi:hypothetical protein